MWRTAGPTRLAGRFHRDKFFSALVMAVSYRFGGAVGRGWDTIAVRWSRTQLWARGEEEKRSHVADDRSLPIGGAVSSR